MTDSHEKELTEEALTLLVEKGQNIIVLAEALWGIVDFKIWEPETEKSFMKETFPRVAADIAFWAEAHFDLVLSRLKIKNEDLKSFLETYAAERGREESRKVDTTEST